MRSDEPSRREERTDRRPFRREESHRQSHAQADDEHLAPLPEHPLASREPPTVVTTAQVLADMIEHLRAAGTFAFDSEFIGERSYVSHLCLVQAATPQKVFLVDPLGGLDLSALWDLLVSPQTEKIVLAGQQDLDPVVRHTGKAPGQIMDVQVAAGFVHVEYPFSLGRLLEEFVGVSVGKAHSFSHWDKRPLTAMQLRYAADDVRYLLAARDAIGKRLSELDRTAWAREECAAMLEDLSLYRTAPEALFLRVRGRERLGRRQLAVLRELAIVRDQAARQEDVPTRTLLNDGILVALARWPARKSSDLGAIRGLPRPVEERYGQQMIEATAKALALPEDRRPAEDPGEHPTLRAQATGVLEGITEFCQQHSIAPAMVTNRKEVVRLCRAASEGRPLGSHRLFRGWRKELLGDMLTKLLP